MNDIGVVIESIRSSLFDCYIININPVAYTVFLNEECLGFVFKWLNIMP